jgi:hypothetical protein
VSKLNAELLTTSLALLVCAWFTVVAHLPTQQTIPHLYIPKKDLATPHFYTVKKGFADFPSPAGMSLTKLFLDGNIFPLLSLKFSLSQAGILTESF